MTYAVPVASGALAPNESCQWYVWWTPTVYRTPTVFQATPYEGTLEVTDHQVTADPPAGINASLAHSLIVTNVGSVQSNYVLWATFSD